MKRIVIQEHGRILRRDLGGSLCQSLQSFDEAFARKQSDTVFDWSRRSAIVAKNYVGVLQVPGLTVEILPKIDDPDGGDNVHRAQDNLLYMLSFTRRLPVRSRDLAGLRTHRQPLLECLIRLFADHMLEELRKGSDHAYVRRRDNVVYIKGRLLMPEQLRRNMAHRERAACEFDEFLPDTWLNRVLKAACVRLVRLTESPWTQRCLKEAVLHLADVRDVAIRSHHFENVVLNRGNERFRNAVTFARIVLTDSTPAPEHGETFTFSLLFPMEQVFEEFIGETLRRFAPEFGWQRSDVHLQARDRRRWLVRDESGRGRFRLKPDVYVGSSDRPMLILDTKWKRLSPDAVDAKNGVLQADMYQLYAYAKQFGCSDNVLLFPQADGVTAKRYSVAGTNGETLRVELVDVGRDLYREQRRFRDILANIVRGRGQTRSAG